MLDLNVLLDSLNGIYNNSTFQLIAGVTVLFYLAYEPGKKLAELPDDPSDEEIEDFLKSFFRYLAIMIFIYVIETILNRNIYL